MEFSRRKFGLVVFIILSLAIVGSTVFTIVFFKTSSFNKYQIFLINKMKRKYDELLQRCLGLSVTIILTLAFVTALLFSVGIFKFATKQKPSPTPTTKTGSTKVRLATLATKSNKTATTTKPLKTNTTTAKTPVSTAKTSNKTVNATTPINKSANTTSSVSRSKPAVKSDSRKFYGISWLDADAYCRNNSLGRLWGSDKRFLTKEGRLEILKNSTIPRDKKIAVCVGITKSGDGKTWRRLSDNGTVNLQGWSVGYPRNDPKVAAKLKTFNYLYVQYFPQDDAPDNGKLINQPSSNCHFRCEK